MRPARRVALFSLALAVNLGVAFAVFAGHSSHALAVVWFLSLVPIALATRVRPRVAARVVSSSGAGLLLFAALFPVLVRVANIDPDRVHGDEFITGYFSATHDFQHKSFFAYMPEKFDWDAQFPTPFFFLQRLFLWLFGTSPWTLRLSVQIYVAVVSGMLFLIVAEMLDVKTAVVAVLLYAFFAISVYLETFGFMFISSTAIFTVFFYFALREYRTGEMFDAAAAGLACGFCYLTYYSSYLALPMLLAFSGARWIRTRTWAVLQNLAIALGAVLMVLAPFVGAGLRSGDYVSRRADEISLLTGQWSTHREEVERGANVLPILKDNLVLALASFRQDGLGGHGGYDFGRRAFFDRLSLALFLLGGLAAPFLMLRRPGLLFVFLVIGAAFAVGIVLTIPPPAYHRFSIAFPFLVILMAVPFFLLWRVPRLPESVRYALAGGLLLLFACRNQRQLAEAAIRDQPVGEVRLSHFLNQRFPDRPLYIAAFPGFGFDRIYYFAGKESRDRRKIQTEYHVNLLKKFNPDEKYVYVMIFAEHFEKSFRQADPRGRSFRFSPAYTVFAN